jgi:hypothetical protein
MPNLYKCTITGKSYSEATIKANLSKAYKEKYQFEPSGICAGCENERGVCSAHYIPKARLKVLKLTSLIWRPDMFFRSCYHCNMVAENISSEEIKKLKNLSDLVWIHFLYDKERFNILTL